MTIGTLAAGVGGGMAEGGEVLDQGQGQDQVGIAMTMPMILEIAGERLDEDVAEAVVPEVSLRHEEEEEDEEVHQQREELSLFLPTMVCRFFPSYSQLTI